jgi:hypothetical protein
MVFFVKTVELQIETFIQICFLSCIYVIIAISPELENEKKVSPEGNKPLDKEAPSIRSSKKKSAFKSLINKTSEIIKLTSQQAPVVDIVLFYISDNFDL